MLELLIDFLDALSRLPGGGCVVPLRNVLREGRLRHVALKASYKGSQASLQRVQRSGGALLATAGAPGSAAAEGDRPGRTLVRPGPAPGAAPASPATPEPDTAHAAAPGLRGAGLNALADAATPLLTLAGALQCASAPADVRALRLALARQVERFNDAAHEARVPWAQRVPARYALCTLLDEVVLSTPWGADSPWARHTLLGQFHGETWGGDKCFRMLERLLAEPQRQQPLLELLHLCLALGLQGRHRVAEGGAVRLLGLRQELYRAIRRLRGPVPAVLCELPPVLPLPPRARLQRWLPARAVAALGLVALAGLYAGFGWSLARQAEPVYAALARLGQDRQAMAPAPQLQRTLTLREALASDIAAGLVEVVEQARGSTVAIRGDTFFASGSAEVEPALQPLLGRIAAALNRFPGTVLVSGHTDNQPVALGRRLRLATNWELSQARAEAVAALLAPRLDQPARLVAEGRGDADPRQPNDTPAHRAQNRRVEVSLLDGAAPAGTAPATPATALSNAGPTPTPRSPS